MIWILLLILAVVIVIGIFLFRGQKIDYSTKVRTMTKMYLAVHDQNKDKVGYVAFDTPQLCVSAVDSPYELYGIGRVSGSREPVTINVPYNDEWPGGSIPSYGKIVSFNMFTDGSIKITNGLATLANPWTGVQVGNFHARSVDGLEGLMNYGEIFELYGSDGKGIGVKSEICGKSIYLVGDGHKVYFSFEKS